jgi:small-conductance mechanosensitive channel
MITYIFITGILPEPVLLYAFFALFFIIVLIVYRFVLKRLKAIALRTETKLDDFLIRLFRFPALWLIFWFSLKLFNHLFITKLPEFEIIIKINNIFLVLSFGWIVIQLVRVLFYQLEKRLDIDNPDNLGARKSLTQMKVFEGLAITVIAVIFISVALMTIESVRSIGISLLTSAGVAGLIIGLAAQKSIGQILSGMQLAITQPIRLDDVVIVEGEWGRIEEITLTYVVVRIWDQRRLILPSGYFLEQPFQNWTRTEASIMGTIFLYVSYELPLEPVREYLSIILKGNPDWDGRVQNIQVTASKEWHKEIRVLLSSSDASKNWDLRVLIREQLIDFINKEYPGSFAKINTELSGIKGFNSMGE